MHSNYNLNTTTKLISRWLYLEPIFGSGTLREEKHRFDKIDRDFRHIIAFIQKDTRVTALCRYSNLKSLIDGLLEQLSRCQLTLDNFLKVISIGDNISRLLIVYYCRKKDKNFPVFNFSVTMIFSRLLGSPQKKMYYKLILRKYFLE